MKSITHRFNEMRLRRPKAMLLAGLVVVAVFLLAAGLTGLELIQPEPEPFNFVFQFWRTPPTSIPADDNLLTIIRIIYLIALIILPFWLVYMIINPEARKRFFRDLLRYSVIMLMVSLSLMAFAKMVSEESEEEPPIEFGTGEVPEMGMPSGEVNPEPPEELIWTAGIILAVILVALISGVAWVIWRSRRRQDITFDAIATEVQAALNDLQSGEDLRNVVIRCYLDMMRALQEQRAVRRSGDMTPREFEEALQKLGFPAAPIHQLTHLFEQVRYGHKPVTRREELMAVDSLTAILEACKLAVQ
jgi:hypothetical protein